MALVQFLNNTPIINSGVYSKSYVTFYFIEKKITVRNADENQETILPEQFGKELWTSLCQQAKIHNKGKHADVFKTDTYCRIGIHGTSGRMFADLPTCP